MISQLLSHLRAQIAPTTLVAVSKTVPVAGIREALAAGQRIFGENRVQETKEKWPELRAEYPDIELHLIGPLQTNKVREAVALFDVIETLDRPTLAVILKKEMERTQRFLECFIQVNTGEEPQKAGVLPGETSAFIDYCRNVLRLPVTGLMCIPPANQSPAPHFTLLTELARQHDLRKLSMGMSADYAEAILHGATHVRVGSAIFGKRSG